MVVRVNMEGMNSRMDAIQAGVLSIKLNHIDDWTAQRQALAQRYYSLLSKVEEVQTPFVQEGSAHVYHLYVIKTEQRDQLRSFLKESGIPTVLNYPKALPFYTAYDYLGHIADDFPCAYHNQSRILSIPIFPGMTKDQQDYVVGQIIKFYGS